MLLFNRYEYDAKADLIGRGGFSRVYKAKDNKLNRWVALKIYKTSDLAERYSPIAEIQRVINLEHPNICRYIDIEEFEKEDAFGEKEKIQVCVLELLDAAFEIGALLFMLLNGRKKFFIIHIFKQAIGAQNKVITFPGMRARIIGCRKSFKILPGP